MSAMAFGLVAADVRRHGPEGVTQAHVDIGATLGTCGQDRIQGSLCVSQTEDLTTLVSAIMASKGLAWLLAWVRDIRACRVEQWSDSTALVET